MGAVLMPSLDALLGNCGNFKRWHTKGGVQSLGVPFKGVLGRESPLLWFSYEELCLIMGSRHDLLPFIELNSRGTPPWDETSRTVSQNTPLVFIFEWTLLYKINSLGAALNSS